MIKQIAPLGFLVEASKTQFGKVYSNGNIHSGFNHGRKDAFESSGGPSFVVKLEDTSVVQMIRLESFLVASLFDFKK